MSTSSNREEYGFGKYGATELPNVFITLSDVCKLSARVYIPISIPDEGPTETVNQGPDSDSSDTVQKPGDNINQEPNSLPFPFSTFKSISASKRVDHVTIISSLTEPDDPEERFPAILEYIPYHKDIHTAERDYARHPWFTSHGFVCLRVEMRGCGSSQGRYYGEYLPQEQRDCEEVLDWIAAQPWSNGRVY
eukprot:sb/3471077/